MSMSKRIRDLCIITQIVIPAQAGIQETTANTGFRVALCLHGMTKLLVLCSYAKLSIHDKVSCLDKPIANNGSNYPPPPQF